MRTQMKQKIKGALKIAAMIAITTIISPNLLAQGQSGNGGGGIIRNGDVMTFGSAKILVDRIDIKTVPEIQLTSLAVLNHPLLSGTLKSDLLKAINPSASRQYRRVSEGEFTNSLLEKIKEEYKKIAKTETEVITLFAITDTSSKVTTLLPDFFRLTSIEKQAILFHEALWIVRPNENYQNIVEAEIAFQAYLEDQKDMSLIDTIYTLGQGKEVLFSQLRELAPIALAYDLARGNLQQLKNDANPSFAKLFPNLKMFCFKGERFSAEYSTCFSNSYNEVFRLSQLNQHAAFPKVLLHAMEINAPVLKLYYGRVFERYMAETLTTNSMGNLSFNTCNINAHAPYEICTE